MRRPKTCDVIYGGDRWKVPGTREVYVAHARNFNGVNHWELYRHETPRAKGELVLYGLQDHFAVLFRTFYNSSALRKVRTPRKDRTGPCVSVWGLSH